jgi:hypothetical protein
MFRRNPRDSARILLHTEFYESCADFVSIARRERLIEQRYRLQPVACCALRKSERKNFGAVPTAIT